MMETMWQLGTGVERLSPQESQQRRLIRLLNYAVGGTSNLSVCSSNSCSRFFASLHSTVFVELAATSPRKVGPL